MQLIRNNKALFGPSLATPGVSLRIVNLTKVTTNDESILSPYPVVELLDLYGAVVQGLLTYGVEITAELTNKDQVQLFGATQSKVKTDGRIEFQSLGLLGIPGSGPHNVYFRSGNNANKSSQRFLKTLASIPTFLKVCPKNEYLDGNQCKSCP